MQKAAAAAVLTAFDVVPLLETKLRLYPIAETQLLYGYILCIVIEKAGEIA